MIDLLLDSPDFAAARERMNAACESDERAMFSVEDTGAAILIRFDHPGFTVWPLLGDDRKPESAE